MPGSPTPSDGDAEAAAPRFRLAFAPGATPGKWARVWEQRLPDVPLELIPAANADALAAVRAGAADAALVRLPVERDGLHAIPLYTETTVVMMPKDHEYTLADSLTPADLAGEVVQHPLDDVLVWPAGGPPGIPAFERPATVPDALALVAAGVGLTVLPQSLARLHHRKDLVYRPLEAPANGTPDDTQDGPAPVARSQMALIWREDRTGELMEEFIGIVRGRTVNSSRGIGRRAAGQGDAARSGAAKDTSSSKGKGGGTGKRSGAGGASGKGGAGAKSGGPRRRAGGPSSQRRGTASRGKGGKGRPRGRR